MRHNYGMYGFSIAGQQGGSEKAGTTVNTTLCNPGATASHVVLTEPNGKSRRLPMWRNGRVQSRTAAGDCTVLTTSQERGQQQKSRNRSAHF